MRSTSFVTSIILISISLAGCGSPVEEQALAAVPTQTPVPTQPPPPTDTPTPMPEPTSTPMAISKWEDTTGIWVRNYKGVDAGLSIYEDGAVSYWFAGSGGPFSIQLWFENGILFASEHTQDYCTNQIGTYEVSGVPGEYLIFEVIDDECASDRALRGKWIEKFSQ